MPWGDEHGARAVMEDAMVDTCRITRTQGEPSYDPTTGDLAPTGPLTVYEGRCMLGQPQTVQRTTVRGGEQEYVTRYPVSIPVTAGPVKVGDQVHYLTCQRDRELVGASLRVVELVHGTLVARRRLLCELTSVGPLL